MSDDSGIYVLDVNEDSHVCPLCDKWHHPLVPVELLTADEQATIMYACQHSDAGRLTRPEEVKLVSLVRTLIEKIGGGDEG